LCGSNCLEGKLSEAAITICSIAAFIVGFGSRGVIQRHRARRDVTAGLALIVGLRRDIIDLPALVFGPSDPVPSAAAGRREFGLHGRG
jgi:hypothetical protein